MLSKKTKYAFKALTYLADNIDKGPILISEISERESIAKKFLEQILLELKNGGFLGSRKGKGGGYYLIKNPKEISLAHIMRMFNGPIALLPCVSLNFYERCDDCKDEETCKMRSIMIQLRDANLRILLGKTIADLQKNPKAVSEAE